MPLIPARTRRRAIAFALIALLLLGAQTLGLAHRVLHGGALAGSQQVDGFGHAPGTFCPLYDQLAGADPLPVATSLAPPLRPASQQAIAAQPTARGASVYRPFQARAPPAFSAA